MKKIQSILMVAVMLLTVMSLLTVPALAAGSANLVTNGDFESPDGEGWTSINTPVFCALTEGEGDSATSNNVVMLAASETTVQPEIYQSMTGFKANTTYALSFDIKTKSDDLFVTSGSNNGLLARVDYNQRLGSAAFFPIYLGVIDAYTDAWLRVGTSFTTSENVTEDSVLVLRLFLNNATGTIYVDDVNIEEVPADTANLASNGSFEVMYTNGFPLNWSRTGGGENPGTTLFMDNTDPYDGNWCVKFDCAANNTLSTGAARERLCLQQNVALTAGKTYRISYAAKVSTESAGVPIFLRQNGSAPQFLNRGGALPSANKWYEVVTYHTPTATGNALFFIGSYSAHWGGGAFYVDNFRVEEVTEARVDFVNPDKNVTELRVIDKPVAGGTAVAFAGLPKTTDKASLVTAVYVQKDGVLRLSNVSISSEVYSGANGVDTTALLKTEAIEVPADAYLVKTYVWSDDEQITPLGESKIVSFAQTVVSE